MKSTLSCLQNGSTDGEPWVDTSPLGIKAELRLSHVPCGAGVCVRQRKRGEREAGRGGKERERQARPILLYTQ